MLQNFLELFRDFHLEGEPRSAAFRSDHILTDFDSGALLSPRTKTVQCTEGPGLSSTCPCGTWADLWRPEVFGFRSLRLMGVLPFMRPRCLLFARNRVVATSGDGLAAGRGSMVRRLIMPRVFHLVTLPLTFRSAEVVRTVFLWPFECLDGHVRQQHEFGDRPGKRL